MRLGQACAAVGTIWLLASGNAGAQTVGTFRWQQQPYCNVFTLTLIQDGASYRLEGADDQCGAPRLAAALGLAFINPDGTIGMGLTVLPNAGVTSAAPLHLDVTVSVATASGTWRDNSGATGAWTFTPGSAATGAIRPAPSLQTGIVTTAALATGAVTTTALADGAVTGGKLAPSAFAGPGAATTVARSDHDHDARYYTQAQIDGRVSSSVLGMGLVSPAGALIVSATGTNVVITRTGAGTYDIMAPGLTPQCGSDTLALPVITPTTGGLTAAVGPSVAVDCGTGNVTATATFRNTSGALTDSGFTFYMFKVYAVP